MAHNTTHNKEDMHTTAALASPSLQARKPSKPVEGRYAVSAEAGTIQAAKDRSTRTTSCVNSQSAVRVSPNPTSERRERLMQILPAPTDEAPPPVSIAPLSAVDGCPGCVSNVEPPTSTVALDQGYRNAYLCSDCGHAWTTDWRD